MISLGSVLPDMVAKFQVNKLEAGLPTLIMPVGLLISSLLFGPLADHYGYKWVLMIAAFLVMLGLEGLAFAPSWGWVSVATFLAGLGGGALNGGTNGLVVDTTVGDNSSARVSLLGVFFGLGALGMPLLIAALSPWFTSEQVIGGIGACILLVLAYMAWLRFPEPKLRAGVSLKDGLGILRYPILWLLSMVLFFQSGLEGIINNWSTTYMQEVLGYVPQRTLLGLTVYMASLTVMRIFLGVLLTARTSRWFLFGGMILMTLGGILWLSAHTYALSLTALVLLGAGFAGVFPIILSEVGARFPTFSGTAFSFALVFSIFGNWTSNYLTTLTGHQYGMASMPVLLMSWIVILFLLVIISQRKFDSEIS